MANSLFYEFQLNYKNTHNRMLLALMKNDKFEFKEKQQLTKEDMKQPMQVELTVENGRGEGVVLELLTCEG